MDLMQALEEFEKHDKQRHSVKAPKEMTMNDVCQNYKVVKPILQWVLPLISMLPNVGPRIVVAIQALMAGLDVVCPVSEVK